MNHLIELDIENLISILKADKLNLINEATLVELVKEYIAERDKIPKKLPKSAKQKAGKELWDLLSDAEKENRELEWKEEEEKKKAKKVESLEKEAQKYFEKDKTGRIQHVLDVK